MAKHNKRIIKINFHIKNKINGCINAWKKTLYDIHISYGLKSHPKKKSLHIKIHPTSNPSSSNPSKPAPSESTAWRNRTQTQHLWDWHRLFAWRLVAAWRPLNPSEKYVNVKMAVFLPQEVKIQQNVWSFTTELLCLISLIGGNSYQTTRDILLPNNLLGPGLYTRTIVPRYE